MDENVKSKMGKLEKRRQGVVTMAWLFGNEIPIQNEGHKAPSEKKHATDIRKTAMRGSHHQEPVGPFVHRRNRSTYHKSLKGLRAVTQLPPNMIDNWEGMDRKSLFSPQRAGK